jgi:hypothetical protein
MLPAVSQNVVHPGVQEKRNIPVPRLGGEGRVRGESVEISLLLNRRAGAPLTPSLSRRERGGCEKERFLEGSFGALRMTR